MDSNQLVDEYSATRQFRDRTNEWDRDNQPSISGTTSRPTLLASWRVTYPIIARKLNTTLCYNIKVI